MPLASIVRLPHTMTPEFPDRCVACGRERPGDHFAISARATGLDAVFMPILWLVRRAVRTGAPACPPCRDAAGRQRRWRGLLVIAVVGVAVPLIYPLAKSWGLPRAAVKLIAGALCLVPLGPIALWMIRHPPAFGILPGTDHVDYEFADPDYARDFAAANNAAVRGVTVGDTSGPRA